MFVILEMECLSATITATTITVQYVSYSIMKLIVNMLKQERFHFKTAATVREEAEDCSQSLFCFVPRESPSQTGSARNQGIVGKISFDFFTFYGSECL